MERLTERTTCGVPNLAYPKSCYFQDGAKDPVAASAYRQQAIERLAAYEDSGLEPEDVRRLQQDWTSLIMTLDELGGMPHLHELVQAEKDGLIPPCKRGDVVYCIRHNPRTGYRVKPLNVCTVTVWGPGHFTIFTTKEDTLGKTVFLTREEAEAALAQKGDSA